MRGLARGGPGLPIGPRRDQGVQGGDVTELRRDVERCVAVASARFQIQSLRDGPRQVLGVVRRGDRVENAEAVGVPRRRVRAVLPRTSTRRRV